MAPSRRKGASKAAAAAAAAARRQWKVGDLVLAKVKGFPAWPATVRATFQFLVKSPIFRLTVLFRISFLLLSWIACCFILSFCFFLDFSIVFWHILRVFLLSRS